MTEKDCKPMTVSDLANRWGVSCPTVSKWLKPFASEIGPKEGNIYNPKQVAIILSKLE